MTDDNFLGHVDQLQANAREAAEFIEEQFGSNPHPESDIPNPKHLREEADAVRERLGDRI